MVSQMDGNQLKAASTATVSEAPFVNLNGDQSLGGQVYKYLRELLRLEKLKPGSLIETGTLARQLGISKTPLRDALIQLQAEGFLKILPQRGVVISTLDASELRQIIQILAGMESKAMMLAAPHITESHIEEMASINKRLYALIHEGSVAYREYNKLNIAFHAVFLNLCGNDLMLTQINTMKERMYHFPDRDYGEVWRRVNADEHQKVMELLKQGLAQEAADFIRDVHWSFDQKKRRIASSQ